MTGAGEVQVAGEEEEETEAAAVEALGREVLAEEAAPRGEEAVVAMAAEVLLVEEAEEVKVEEAPLAAAEVGVNEAVLEEGPEVLVVLDIDDQGRGSISAVEISFESTKK
ncbi:hypothetical protein CORC01_05320 [Colletotrichum orchidophilum]|uniref:Uncharacterized protein n=1 Tax=Colletotrichum orchidophilum TaxID=1209926 RepID=A0A1G4BCY2_9PEZI|nr:uncharacterized protein CORC01_05320 [Colletotrichum orchidophilum]OHE99279.1 hypothetical protein CORC01_05320 [Colletotrichum orchidophilum]